MQGPALKLGFRLYVVSDGTVQRHIFIIFMFSAVNQSVPLLLQKHWWFEARACDSTAWGVLCLLAEQPENIAASNPRTCGQGSWPPKGNPTSFRTPLPPLPFPLFASPALMHHFEHERGPLRPQSQIPSPNAMLHLLRWLVGAVCLAATIGSDFFDCHLGGVGSGHGKAETSVGTPPFSVSVENNVLHYRRS